MQKRDFKKFLASGFGLGLLPLIPGTFGAVVGLIWHLISYIMFANEMYVRIWCLCGALFFAALHYWLTPWAQEYWNDSDPKNFVLDEVVGYLCVPVFIISSFVAIWQIVAAFVLFRILDAIKLPGARYVDRNIHSANGVLFDDVISAGYTAVIMSAII